MHRWEVATSLCAVSSGLAQPLLPRSGQSGCGQFPATNPRRKLGIWNFVIRGLEEIVLVK